jgi:hypothetical protein
MQYAATAANEMIAQQYMKALDPFFEPADDGSLIPAPFSWHWMKSTISTCPGRAFYTARADAGKNEGQPDDPHGRDANPVAAGG